LNTASKQKCDAVSIRHSVALDAAKTRVTAEAWGKERPFYKPLPAQFRHNGCDYRQIVREGDAAVYEQTWDGCPNPSICYEVIRIRRRGRFQIGARFIEPAEVYPNAEAWGVDGFTLTDKEAAFRKLREIVGQGWGGDHAKARQ
jgi:hypothetical protein